MTSDLPYPLCSPRCLLDPLRADGVMLRRPHVLPGGVHGPVLRHGRPYRVEDNTHLQGRVPRRVFCVFSLKILFCICIWFSFLLVLLFLFVFCLLFYLFVCVGVRLFFYVFIGFIDLFVYFFTYLFILCLFIFFKIGGSKIVWIFFSLPWTRVFVYFGRRFY